MVVYYTAGARTTKAIPLAKTTREHPQRRMAHAPNTRIAISLGIATLLIVAARPLLACKYSVRDVTFVDLQGKDDHYRLELHLPNTGPAAVVDPTEEAARAILLGSNVDLEHGKGDAKLPLPAALLVDPNGRELWIPLADLGDSTDGPGNGARAGELRWQRLETVVDSPLRRKLRALLPKTHSVVVVVEGSDAAERERAVAAARGAIADVVAEFDSLPKDAGEHPKLIRLSAEQAAEERVFLWCLGVRPDSTSWDTPSADRDTHVAVFSGRFRRVGPLRSTPGLTRGDILSNLSVVGQDCECGLDRSWMEGRMLPHRWSAEDDAALFKQLGFDAQNPFVKTEISRILSRRPTPSPQPTEDTPSGVTDTSSEPFLGYEEIPVDFEASGEVAQEHESTSSTTHLATAGSERGAPESGDTDPRDADSRETSTRAAADAVRSEDSDPSSLSQSILTTLAVLAIATIVLALVSVGLRRRGAA